MMILVTIVHVIACFFLIVVVLLQTGKGADMGAVFGGGSQTLFGTGGAGNFLTRLTTGTAIVFMVTSLILTYGSGQRHRLDHHAGERRGPQHGRARGGRGRRRRGSRR